MTLQSDGDLKSLFYLTMAAYPSLHYPQRVGEPDCRDYLRTGRCKYGESCKYNHPPNVESGGGIKAPLDPSEPQFPIRLGEPHCQYFLKHGTCKFGQTCKFHHPPHVVTTGSAGGLAGTVMMNVLNASPGHSGQIIALNSVDNGIGEMQTQVLQLLPQRPGEQDCIYFLRNGRCKYGATCKYHHPIDQRQAHHHQDHSYVQVAPQSRLGRLRSSSVGSSADAGPGNLSAVQLMPPSGAGHGSYSQRKEEPTHIIVSEGPIRVMTLNQGCSNRNTNQYQQASNNSSPAITSTSVSSYETAVSSLDYIPASAHSQGQPDSSGRYWRRTVSHEHLSLGGLSPQVSHGNLQRLSSSHHGGANSGRMPLHHSSSSMDTERVQREHISSHHRFAEVGRSIQEDPRLIQAGGGPLNSSGTDSLYPPSQNGARWPAGSTATVPVPTGIIGDRSWDDGSDTAFRRPSSSSEGVLGQGFLSSDASDYYQDQSYDGAHQPMASMGRHEPDTSYPMQSQRSRGHDAGSETDEGLSQMTSALLTMLDTQDGAPQPAASFRTTRAAQDHQSSYHQDTYYSPGPSTPRQSGASMPRTPSFHDALPRTDSSGSFQHTRQYSRPPSNGHDSYQTRQDYNGRTFIPSHHHPEHANQGNSYASQEGSYIGGREDGHSFRRTRSAVPVPQKWSPTWENAKLPGHQMEQSAQSLSALQPGSSATNPNQTNGGLFLS